MSDLPLSPIKQVRRAKIIGAAEHLFVTNGYRAVTMEGVATAAGVSKATLYGYFRDKDALFDAVAGAIADDMQAAFDTALGQDGTVAKRICAALIAKHHVVHDRVRQSRFASELFAIKDRASAQRFRILDDGFVARIMTMLTDTEMPAQTAEKIANMLFAASQGIANAAESPEQMAEQIRMLEILISGQDRQA